MPCPHWNLFQVGASKGVLYRSATSTTFCNTSDLLSLPMLAEGRFQCRLQLQACFLAGFPPPALTPREAGEGHGMNLALSGCVSPSVRQTQSSTSQGFCED